MIPISPETQYTLPKAPEKKMIDYEKSRSNDYNITLPQRHVPTEFKAAKQTFYMPTYYALDKQFEENFRCSFSNGQNNSNKNESDSEKDKNTDIDNNVVKEEENEDRIHFLFKVKPKRQRRQSMSDFSSSYTTLMFARKTFRKRQSDDGIPLRHRSDNDDVSNTLKSSIIKQILRKSKNRRVSSSHTV